MLRFPLSIGGTHRRELRKDIRRGSRIRFFKECKLVNLITCLEKIYYIP